MIGRLQCGGTVEMREVMPRQMLLKRESAEGVRARRGELVVKDESAVIAKQFLDAVVMGDSQCGGCVANPSGTDECNGFQVFNETNGLLD